MATFGPWVFDIVPVFFMNRESDRIEYYFIPDGKEMGAILPRHSQEIRLTDQ